MVNAIRIFIYFTKVKSTEQHFKIHTDINITVMTKKKYFLNYAKMFFARIKAKTKRNAIFFPLNLFSFLDLKMIQNHVLKPTLMI